MMSSVVRPARQVSAIGERREDTPGRPRLYQGVEQKRFRIQEIKRDQHPAQSWLPSFSSLPLGEITVRGAGCENPFSTACLVKGALVDVNRVADRRTPRTMRVSQSSAGHSCGDNLSRGRAAWMAELIGETGCLSRCAYVYLSDQP
jgi:hypothetical protein